MRASCTANTRAVRAPRRVSHDASSAGNTGRSSKRSTNGTRDSQSYLTPGFQFPVQLAQVQAGAGNTNAGVIGGDRDPARAGQQHCRSWTPADYDDSMRNRDNGGMGRPKMQRRIADQGHRVPHHQSRTRRPAPCIVGVHPASRVIRQPAPRIRRYPAVTIAGVVHPSTIHKWIPAEAGEVWLPAGTAGQVHEGTVIG